jgi:hypothetical protein
MYSWQCSASISLGLRLYRVSLGLHRVCLVIASIGSRALLPTISRLVYFTLYTLTMSCIIITAESQSMSS